MTDFNKVLDFFFTSENRVIVIKGDWGVGKTYFWERYYRNNKSKLSKVAYSYVSLFGKNSVNDIKREIFHYATPLDVDKYNAMLNGQNQNINGKFLSKIKSFAKYNRASKLIIKYLDNTTFGFRAGPLISALEYGFISEYIICIDDLERKGNALEIKEVMGLVDELARKKNCKIVLIFNEKNLKNEDEEKQFSEYREKIVDLDVMYNPSIADNLGKVFLPQNKNRKHIEKIVHDINLRNLRILNKIKTTLDTFDEYFNVAVEGTRQDFAKRVTLFSTVYYSGVDYVTYEDFTREMNAGLRGIMDIDEQDKTPAMEFFDKIDITNRETGRKFDEDIDFYLINGYIKPQSRIKEIIKSSDKEYANIEINNRIANVWSIYTESFESNDAYFISEIESLLKDNLQSIPLSRLGSLMDMLEALGVNCDKYVDEYVRGLTEKDIESLKIEAWFDIHTGFEKLTTALNSKISYYEPKASIEEILTRFSASDSYNSRDVIELNVFTEDDYYQWLTNHKDDVIGLVKHGLLKFSGLSNPTPEQTQVTEKARKALLRVAKKSTLNKLRVKHITKIT